MRAFLATVYPGGFWAISLGLAGIVLTLIGALGFGVLVLVRKQRSQLRAFTSAYWVNVSGLLFLVLSAVVVAVDQMNRPLGVGEFWSSVFGAWRWTVFSVVLILLEWAIIRRVKNKS